MLDEFLRTCVTIMKIVKLTTCIKLHISLRALLHWGSAKHKFDEWSVHSEKSQWDVLSKFLFYDATISARQWEILLEMGPSAILQPYDHGLWKKSLSALIAFIFLRTWNNIPFMHITCINSYLDLRCLTF